MPRHGQAVHDIGRGYGVILPHGSGVRKPAGGDGGDVRRNKAYTRRPDVDERA